jgi:hypothetical protein
MQIKQARCEFVAQGGCSDRLTAGPVALARIIPVPRRESAHEIAHHPINLIRANLRETLPNRLGPKPRGGITLVVPVLLKLPGKRHRSVAAQRVW